MSSKLATLSLEPTDGDSEVPSGRTNRTSHYTELDGGSGRDIYFRPERYQRAQLGSVGVKVQVDTGYEVLSCELHDVSQNGVAFEVDTELMLQPGAVLPEVVLHFDDHEAYRGRARVSSVRRIDGAMLVGASFIDTLMNIEDVLHLRDVKSWIGESHAPGLVFEEATWRVSGQSQFKASVAELRLFLEDAQDQLSELEKSLPWHVLHGEESTPARDALIRQLENGFAQDVVELSANIDRALRGATRAERGSLREYSVRHLHSLLMQSPWMHRARHKPLGYPGDFEVMNSVYTNLFRGPSLFAKALSMSFACTPAARAVRTRKDLVKSELAALLASRASGEPIRILSIAAGPAQEVYELLEEQEEIRVPLEVVLFDQDKQALAFSHGRLQRLVTNKWHGQVKVLHLHDSIKRLLRGSTVFSVSGAFDAVYACGLFDYLQPHTWVSLCRTLFGATRDGGSLYVGNMVPENPSRWFMELHLDWFLEYRERQELLALGAKAVPDAELELLEEATGVNPIVKLTRV